MKKLILLGLILFSVISCQNPSPAGAQASTDSAKYDFQVINDKDLGGVIIYVLNKNNGKVYVRTGDGKWFDISGEGLSAAKPLQ